MPADDPTRAGRVEVDDRGHPRIRAPPHRVGQDPTGPPGPGLIDPDHRGQLRRGQQLHGRGDQDPMHCGPRQVELGADLRHRPVGRHHRRSDLDPQPGRQPGPRRQLVTDLGERPARAQPFSTNEPALTHRHPQPDRPVRQVLDPAHRPVLHQRRGHPTRRAATLSGDVLHQDQAGPIRSDTDIKDPEPGQREQQRRTVRHDSWPLLQVGVGTTSMSRPRASTAHATPL